MCFNRVRKAEFTEEQSRSKKARAALKILMERFFECRYSYKATLDNLHLQGWRCMENDGEIANHLLKADFLGSI